MDSLAGTRNQRESEVVTVIHEKRNSAAVKQRYPQASACMARFPRIHNRRNTAKLVVPAGKASPLPAVFQPAETTPA